MISLRERKQMLRNHTAKWASDHPWSLLYIGLIVTVSLILQVIWR